MTETNANLQKGSNIAFIAGALGAAVSAFAFFQNRDTFALAYMPAWLFWFGITVGSFPLIMIHHLTSGGWGFAIRRIQENLLKALPVCLVLFIPIGLSMHSLYEWTHAEHIAHDPILQSKSLYLNVTGFWIRLPIYFAIWFWMAAKLRKHSAIQDENPTRATAKKLSGYGGAGVLIYTLTITFAIIDWVMSLEPHWFSTIYGAIFMIHFAMSSLAVSILFGVYFSKKEPMKTVFSVDRMHDLGSLLFASIMLWAYTSVSQLIIIWSANIQEEVPWYLHRSTGGWEWVAAAIFIFHFVVPFFLLLMRFIKRKAERLVKVAILILIMRWVELIWHVKPTLVDHPSFSWVDVATWVAIGGIWLGFVLRNFSSAQLTFKQDPIFHAEEHH
ncbi:MAG TPA: hypothetical protein PLY88_00610 [Candidatus Omnitrophota bacterium]|nr:hypothetical protein [Candidatus Omnitrophota bacterium]HRK61033.1 hypothetical protein [Candidatus Omnitrophota bacterium]